MNIKYYAITDCGVVRKKNQDNYLVLTGDNGVNSSGVSFCDAITTLAVFDGMGGEEKGEMASYIAKEVSRVILEKYPDFSVKQLIQQINTQICNYAQENSVKSMGTTAVFARFSNDYIEICNIGDSRAYRIADGKMMCLSKDHAIDVGNRRVLTQNLGIPEEEMVLEPHQVRGQIKEGDIFLLCSDGLTDMVDDEFILKTINEYSLEKSASVLLTKALENGGKDNITIIVSQVY